MPPAGHQNQRSASSTSSRSRRRTSRRSPDYSRSRPRRPRRIPPTDGVTSWRVVVARRMAAGALFGGRLRVGSGPAMRGRASRSTCTRTSCRSTRHPWKCSRNSRPRTLSARSDLNGEPPVEATSYARDREVAHVLPGRDPIEHVASRAHVEAAALGRDGRPLETHGDG